MAKYCTPAEIWPLWTIYHRYDAVQNYTVAVAKVVQEIGGDITPYVPPGNGDISSLGGDRKEKGISLTSRNPNYFWIARNIFFIHLCAVCGFIAPFLYYLTHSVTAYDSASFASEGCSGVFNCTGNAGT